MSRATFFRYFSSLGELRSEALARVTERHPELFTIPDIGAGSLEERIERFVDARMRFHETLHPMELLTRAHAAREADTADFIDANRQVLADQARQHFDTELQSVGPERRADMVTAIAVLTSVESWEQFRRSHHRSPTQARRARPTALAGILADSSSSTRENNGE